VGKSIVNYRDQHGPFQSFGDFQKLYALNPEKIEILVHYITFE
jgi:DNA uptake protein ComE-like DNA-binding protein